MNPQPLQHKTAEESLRAINDQGAPNVWTEQEVKAAVEWYRLKYNKLIDAINSDADIDGFGDRHAMLLLEAFAPLYAQEKGEK